MSNKQASRQTRANVLESVHQFDGHGNHWAKVCKKPSKQSAKIPSAESQSNNQALPIEGAPFS